MSGYHYFMKSVLNSVSSMIRIFIITLFFSYLLIGKVMASGGCRPAFQEAYKTDALETEQGFFSPTIKVCGAWAQCNDCVELSPGDCRYIWPSLVIAYLNWPDDGSVEPEICACTTFACSLPWDPAGWAQSCMKGGKNPLACYKIPLAPGPEPFCEAFDSSTSVGFVPVRFIEQSFFNPKARVVFSGSGARVGMNLNVESLSSEEGDRQLKMYNGENHYFTTRRDGLYSTAIKYYGKYGSGGNVVGSGSTVIPSMPRPTLSRSGNSNVSVKFNNCSGSNYCNFTLNAGSQGDELLKKLDIAVIKPKLKKEDHTFVYTEKCSDGSNPNNGKCDEGEPIRDYEQDSNSPLMCVKGFDSAILEYNAKEEDKNLWLKGLGKKFVRYAIVRSAEYAYDRYIQCSDEKALDITYTSQDLLDQVSSYGSGYYTFPQEITGSTTGGTTSVSDPCSNNMAVYSYGSSIRMYPDGYKDGCEKMEQVYDSQGTKKFFCVSRYIDEDKNENAILTEREAETLKQRDLYNSGMCVDNYVRKSYPIYSENDNASNSNNGRVHANPASATNLPGDNIIEDLLQSLEEYRDLFEKLGNNSARTKEDDVEYNKHLSSYSVGVTNIVEVRKIGFSRNRITDFKDIGSDSNDSDSTSNIYNSNVINPYIMNAAYSYYVNSIYSESDNTNYVDYRGEYVEDYNVVNSDDSYNSDIINPYVVNAAYFESDGVIENSNIVNSDASYIMNVSHSSDTSNSVDNSSNINENMVEMLAEVLDKISKVQDQKDITSKRKSKIFMRELEEEGYSFLRSSNQARQSMAQVRLQLQSMNKKQLEDLAEMVLYGSDYLSTLNRILEHRLNSLQELERQATIKVHGEFNDINYYKISNILEDKKDDGTVVSNKDAELIKLRYRDILIDEILKTHGIQMAKLGKKQVDFLKKAAEIELLEYYRNNDLSKDMRERGRDYYISDSNRNQFYQEWNQKRKEQEVRMTIGRRIMKIKTIKELRDMSDVEYNNMKNNEERNQNEIEEEYNNTWMRVPGQWVFSYILRGEITKSEMEEKLVPSVIKFVDKNNLREVAVKKYDDAQLNSHKSSRQTRLQIPQNQGTISSSTDNTVRGVTKIPSENRVRGASRKRQNRSTTENSDKRNSEQIRSDNSGNDNVRLGSDESSANSQQNNPSTSRQNPVNISSQSSMNLQSAQNLLGGSGSQGGKANLSSGNAVNQRGNGAVSSRNADDSENSQSENSQSEVNSEQNKPLLLKAQEKLNQSSDENQVEDAVASDHSDAAVQRKSGNEQQLRELITESLSKMTSDKIYHIIRERLFDENREKKTYSTQEVLERFRSIPVQKREKLIERAIMSDSDGELRDLGIKDLSEMLKNSLIIEEEAGRLENKDWFYKYYENLIDNTTYEFNEITRQSNYVTDNYMTDSMSDVALMLEGGNILGRFKRKMKDMQVKEDFDKLAELSRKEVKDILGKEDIEDILQKFDLTHLKEFIRLQYNSIRLDNFRKVKRDLDKDEKSELELLSKSVQNSKEKLENYLKEKGFTGDFELYRKNFLHNILAPIIVKNSRKIPSPDQKRIELSKVNSIKEIKNDLINSIDESLNKTISSDNTLEAKMSSHCPIIANERLEDTEELDEKDLRKLREMNSQKTARYDNREFLESKSARMSYGGMRGSQGNHGNEYITADRNCFKVLARLAIDDIAEEKSEQLLESDKKKYNDERQRDMENELMEVGTGSYSGSKTIKVWDDKKALKICQQKYNLGTEDELRELRKKLRKSLLRESIKKIKCGGYIRDRVEQEQEQIVPVKAPGNISETTNTEEEKLVQEGEVKQEDHTTSRLKKISNSPTATDGESRKSPSEENESQTSPMVVQSIHRSEQAGEDDQVEPRQSTGMLKAKIAEIINNKLDEWEGNQDNRKSICPVIVDESVYNANDLTSKGLADLAKIKKPKCFSDLVKSEIENMMVQKFENAQSSDNELQNGEANIDTKLAILKRSIRNGKRKIEQCRTESNLLPEELKNLQKELRESLIRQGMKEKAERCNEYKQAAPVGMAEAKEIDKEELRKIIAKKLNEVTKDDKELFCDLFAVEKRLNTKRLTTKSLKSLNLELSEVTIPISGVNVYSIDRSECLDRLIGAEMSKSLEPIFEKKYKQKYFKIGSLDEDKLRIIENEIEHCWGVLYYQIMGLNSGHWVVGKERFQALESARKELRESLIREEIKKMGKKSCVFSRGEVETVYEESIKDICGSANDPDFIKIEAWGGGSSGYIRNNNVSSGNSGDFAMGTLKLTPELIDTGKIKIEIGKGGYGSVSSKNEGGDTKVSLRKSAIGNYTPLLLAGGGGQNKELYGDAILSRELLHPRFSQGIAGSAATEQMPRPNISLPYIGVHFPKGHYKPNDDECTKANDKMEESKHDERYPGAGGCADQAKRVVQGGSNGKVVLTCEVWH